MFFISKVIGFFLSPLIWGIILIGITIFINNLKIRKKLLLIIFGILIFFSNGHISRLFIKSMESPLITDQALKDKYDYGIVLGGFSHYFPQSKRLQFNRSSDRILQTINLYFKGRISKIIVAGGSGYLINNEEKESVHVKEFLLTLGIPEKDILIEDQSRNTFENAKNTANLYGNDSLSYLLITSAFHMKRAYECFEPKFKNIDPYPVHFKIFPEKEKGQFLKGFLPSSEALESWDLILKELIGRLAYKFKKH